LHGHWVETKGLSGGGGRDAGQTKTGDGTVKNWKQCKDVMIGNRKGVWVGGVGG